MNDPQRYALCEHELTATIDQRLVLPGMKPTHLAAGLACAMRNIGVPEREIRSALAAVLLVGPDGKMLPPSLAHAEVDHAHALMSLPPGSVSPGGHG